MKCICILFFSLVFGGGVLRAQDPVNNKPLADSLTSWVALDQTAAGYSKEKWEKLTKEQSERYGDSVFTLNKSRLIRVMDKYGFPGFNLVGKKGSNDFWLMVQHCDKDVAFQQRVLDSMERALSRNDADPKNFAYLKDRVLLNTGQKQLYGTQVTYNTDTCQAIPKPLADSLNVNKRRASIGLEPIEPYLNLMSSMHFQMNKAVYENKGIHQPKLIPETKQ